MLTQFVLCVVNVRFFLLLHMNCCWLVYWLFFLLSMFFVHLCILYLLVVRAASIDGCLCLSGSLPLLSCMLVLIVF